MQKFCELKNLCIFVRSIRRKIKTQNNEPKDKIRNDSGVFFRRVSYRNHYLFSINLKITRNEHAKITRKSYSLFKHY